MRVRSTFYLFSIWTAAFWTAAFRSGPPRPPGRARRAAATAQ
ncbi:hypothetical protein HMPREF0972_01185 [Actinomyces sp. oral taxon 848 str. F0332]|nr:hypothetical protein HMPREF0972_01185 [Actinomyces sp. oral taxon 848 str. F0332]